MHMLVKRRIVLTVVLLSLAARAHAVPVSYTANLSTSKGNPVTDILILESDGAGPARVTIYPTELPGHGTAVISHDSPITPTRSLIVGLTVGADENGADKIQIIMFLDRDFAAARAGVKTFSTSFTGVGHDETILNMQAAAAGDTAQLAWFASTFFSATAPAAFATGGPFVVGEFSVLNVIGNSATAGNWMITSFQSLPIGNPNAQSNRTTALINETAKVDTGPFDIELMVDVDGEYAIDKTVLNSTGLDWHGFLFVLGTGVGPDFVPSTGGDGLSFISSLNNREETGAFPNVNVDEDRVAFGGELVPGDSARFVVFVRTDTAAPHRFTLRQVALASAATAPALHAWGMVALIAALLTLASVKIRRRYDAR